MEHFRARKNLGANKYRNQYSKKGIFNEIIGIKEKWDY
jgi:hypothetical protein